MRVMKASIPAAALAMVLASIAMPSAANAKKAKHHHGHHHHHSHKHYKKHRGTAAAIAATAAVVGAAAYYDCKKWKARYKSTGNPYYLDRYYACKY